MRVTREFTALLIESPYVEGLMLVARMLGAAGFHVITVYNDKDISERLEKLQQLDLIVFDANLVSSDGERFAESYYAQIKANPNTQHVPLIIISNENEKNLLDKLNADIHIIKPIDPDKFDKILLNYLNE